MKEMRLRIPSNTGNKFFILLSILKFIPPYNRLTKREREVLAELYYHNAALAYIEEEKRMKLVFDYDTRLEIATKLNVSSGSIYNIVASLKRKGLLENRAFVEKYVLHDVDSLIFEFLKDGNSV